MRTHSAIKLVRAVAVPKAVTVSCVGRNNTSGVSPSRAFSCGTTTWFSFDSGDESIHPSVHGLFGLAASLLSGGQLALLTIPIRGLLSSPFFFVFLFFSYRVLSGWLFFKKNLRWGKIRRRSKWVWFTVERHFCGV